MYFLILLNFILFTLGQLVAISRSGGGLNIYLFDIFLFFLNFILVINILKRGKFKINFPLFSFTLFFIFSLIFTGIQIYYFDLKQQIQVFSYVIRFSNYFLFGYLLYSLLSSKLLSIDELKKILQINFFVLSILNLLQLIFLNNLSSLAEFGWDPHLGRLTGTFLDPNYMAYYLCLYYLLNHFYLKDRWIEYLSIFSIFLTLSRNGILTFFIVFVLCNLRDVKKLTLLLIMILIFMLFDPRLIDRFLQFQDREDSSYVRLISWNEALKIGYMTNFSGIGFNNYKNNLEIYNIVSQDSLTKNSVASSDSSFLHVFVTLGLLGFLLLLVNLISFVFGKNSLIFPNLVVLISLIFNSQFINSLFFPQISLLLFLILFMGIFISEQLLN